MTDEFIPVSDITDRDELITIWNYYVSKKKLLVNQNAKKDKIKEIKDYLIQLDNRDKEIKRYNAKKRYAEQKKFKKEAEIREKQMIETVKKELEEDKQKKEEIKHEMQELEKEMPNKTVLIKMKVYGCINLFLSCLKTMPPVFVH